MQVEQTNVTEQTSTGTTESAAAPQVTDLDGLSKFSFQGQEYTPDELVKIVNGYKTASEQVQSLSKDQDFLENLDADIEHVLKNPALADKFKATYPQRFHAILDRVLKSGRPEPASTPAAAPNNLPPEFTDKLRNLEERVAHYDQQAREAAVEKATAEIDRITEPLFKKFPLADNDAVFARAEALINSGMRLTDKVWERLVRENHDAIQKRWDQTQGTLLKEQIEKGRSAQDVGPGGSAPGQAPKGPRTMAEAREAAFREAMG